MTTNCSKFIRREIAMNGNMNVADFMGHALSHPEHGYYMNKDPFGVAGDFTTAPEISQIFGEVLGAWVANIWMLMDNPPAFALLECGPGRGTLMADMLRAADQAMGFRSACKPYLLEVSPLLKTKQQETLEGVPFDCTWIERLSDVPKDMPLIVIGNEFLDALPIHQLERNVLEWHERVVSVVAGNLEIVTQPAPASLLLHVPKSLVQPKHEDVFEISPARAQFAKDLAAHLNKTGGVGLFIDYGHPTSAVGDTLQAVYQHKYCDVLKNIGEADLTAHVDFQAIKDIFKKHKVTSVGLLPQGEFLTTLGANIRAAYLKEKAKDEAQKKALELGLQRLVEPDQMGRLFKVLGFSKGYDFHVPGF